ncbi:MAG: response regulator, partial [Elusimicrobia bacterium]|nr:response regulator [Elusimicrobiota bacterium]MBD3412360.1 response regulator [Elusimicrobiota bacterium]
LIIEDDRDVLDFIALALEDTGLNFSVSTASNNQEIQRHLATMRPDLIILDLMMPGTTGFIVCKNYRQQPGNEKTRILAITGYDTPENKARIIECGANDYLAKPFALDHLKEKVMILLDKK